MALFGRDRFIEKPVIVREERTHYVERNVNVTEHRAPTDESVRLLREMEEAAEKNVLDRVKLADNGFECALTLYRDAMNDEVRVIARYKLNGRVSEVEHRIPTTQFSRRPQEKLEAILPIRVKIAEDIASQMLAAAFSTMRETI